MATASKQTAEQHNVLQGGVGEIKETDYYVLIVLDYLFGTRHTHQ